MVIPEDEKVPDSSLEICHMRTDIKPCSPGFRQWTLLIIMEKVGVPEHPVDCHPSTSSSSRLAQLSSQRPETQGCSVSNTGPACVDCWGDRGST